jgi:transposase
LAIVMRNSSKIHCGQIDQPPADHAVHCRNRATLDDAGDGLALGVVELGYAGGKLRQALAKLGTWTLDIVRRSDAAKGFQPLPRRWVVERTITWLNRNRRLAKDFEATIESAQAWLFIASVKLLSRRIARA